jgi:hypothetical protein
MPIEDLEEGIQNDKIVVKNKEVFAKSNTVIAGFAVRHPLYECKLLLLGFTDVYPSDQENTKVTGMHFMPPDYYKSIPFYPKLVIDLKQNPYNHYVNDEREIKFNYYYYLNITDKFARHGSDVIYAICKYREDGKIKHAFFNLHEITPDL